MKKAAGDSGVLYCTLEFTVAPLDHACGPDCLCWEATEADIAQNPFAGDAKYPKVVCIRKA